MTDIYHGNSTLGLPGQRRVFLPDLFSPGVRGLRNPGSVSLLHQESAKKWEAGGIGCYLTKKAKAAA